jgi:DNA invertase Pin-like site-specific DNA recombinase
MICRRYTMIYGYARVSTANQKLERQTENIRRDYPDVTMMTEKFTGTTTDRPEWVRLMKKVRAGDTIVFDSVSRMSRNKTEGVEDYFALYNKGVELVFLKEPHINTSVYRNALKTAVPLTGTSVDCILNGINEYLQILAKQQIEIAFDQAQKEVDDLHNRVAEGMRISKAGKKISESRKGKKYPRAKTKDIKDAILTLSKDFNGTLNDKQVAKLAGTSIATYYRVKKELRTQC